MQRFSQQSMRYETQLIYLEKKMLPWKENVTLTRIACWPTVTAEMMSK